MKTKLAALMPRREYRTAAVIVVVLLLGAFWVRSGINSDAFVGEIDRVLLAAIGAYGLNLITGFAGQASMGNGGFMAIGAMTAWYLGHNGHSLIVAVLAGTVAGLIIGAVVGAVALRWRGFYLVLATLAVQYIVVFLIQRDQLNGPLSRQAGYNFPVASIFGHDLLAGSDWYVVIAVVLAIVVLLIAGLLNGPLGRAWMALRENERAAAVAGVNVVWVKVLAFATGSAIISLGGALAGYYAGAVGYESYPLSVAVSYVAMIIVGGVGSMAGPLLGAIFITMIPYWVSDFSNTNFGQTVLHAKGSSNLPYIQVLVYCVIVLLFLALEPRGLAVLGSRVAGLVRRASGRGEATESGPPVGPSASGTSASGPPAASLAKTAVPR